MPKRILIIDGHPDARAERYVHALSKAYFDGAHAGGHEIRHIIVSETDFPFLHTSDDFQNGEAPEAIRKCQELICWADHVVILFPLWLGSMPALLKGFLEQTLRPRFALEPPNGRGLPKPLLSGKSARVIVTMGMPAFAYRWYFRAHGVKALERNILRISGIRSVKTCLIGAVERIGPAGRGRWLEQVRALGAHAH
jgi:putative NADPH-quinone reductase